MKLKTHILLLFALLPALLVGCASNPLVQVTTPGTPNPVSPSGPGIEFPATRIQVAAPGPNPQLKTPDKEGHVASILLGIWHGVISPVTLVFSFVNPQVQIYEVHNDGGPYNLGFLLGIVVLLVLIGIGLGRRG